MSVLVFDECNYTIKGLKDYSRHSKQRFGLISNPAPTLKLSQLLHHITPHVVVVNEAFLLDHKRFLSELKGIMLSNKETLFVIFVTSLNIHYQELVFLADNVIICSKEISKTKLGELLSPEFSTTQTATEACRFTLSPAERLLANFWMSGMGTQAISDSLNITCKTVSSHKGNIKKKFKTHNMQVIYNVIRLSDVLLSATA